MEPLERIEAMERDLADGRLDLRAAKESLAHAVTARYHGTMAADAEAEWFKATFSRKNFPDDCMVVTIAAGEQSVADIVALFDPRLSKSEIRRLVAQGGVRVGETRICSHDERIKVEGELRVRVGKRGFFRVTPGGF